MKMSEYIIIVNKTKKQFFSPAAFYDNEKVQNTLREIHGPALGLLLLDQYNDASGLEGSWFGDAIAILGDTRSSGPKRKDEYFEVQEKFEDIGPKLLALVFENISDLREELVGRAKKNKNFLPYFMKSAREYGGVNMKHSLEKHFGEKKT
jgi:hypothetical protein